MEKNAVKEYELTYLEKSGGEKTQERFDIHKFLEGFGAKVNRISQLGEKSLSYPIKKANKAQVVSLVFEAKPSKLPEIERALQLEENILRHLLVKEVIRPSEKVKPAILAAEKVVESKELEKKPARPPKPPMEDLEKKLGELIGETDEEKS